MAHAIVLAGVALAVMAQAPEPDGAGVRPGVLPQEWITGGPKCIEIPEFQVHEYNSDFYILRQSGCSHYEKPFLYLLFGEGRALLLDTGAGMPGTARTVMGVVKNWCRRNGRGSIRLVVAHTHNHSGHVAGDEQFRGMPNVTFVGADYETAVAYWVSPAGLPRSSNTIWAIACSTFLASPATRGLRSLSTAARPACC